MSTDTQNQDDFLPPFARKAAPYWLLALIVFATYINIFNNNFLFDDNLIIQINSFLPDWNHIGDILTESTTSGAHIAGGFYRPVQIFMYLLMYHLGGGTEFWFHALNLSLQIINTCLVYRLGTKLGFNPYGVFLAALVWGVHPLHTEAITYMSGTADPLYVFFSLSALIVLLPDITARKILIIFPLFLLALLSKETAVMFPLLVMSCVFYTNPQRLNIRTYVRTLPLWGTTALYVFWRMHAPGFDGPQTYQHTYNLHEYANLKLYADNILYRAYTFLATLPAYLELLLYPTGLHMERTFPIFVAFAGPAIGGFFIALIALGLIAAPFIGKKTQASEQKNTLPLCWGLLWFGAAHSPDSGLLITMNSLFLEHWMYMPTVGLFLGLAETIVRLLRHKPAALAYGGFGIVMIFVGALSFKSHAQNQIWHDPESFYTDMFSYGVVSARARNNLALYYSDKGDYDKAIEQFKQAIAISDIYAETRFNLALTYLHMPDQRGHADIAIENLNRSLEINPNFYRSYNTLGDIYGTLLHDSTKADYYHSRAKELLDKLSQ